MRLILLNGTQWKKEDKRHRHIRSSSNRKQFWTRRLDERRNHAPGPKNKKNINYREERWKKRTTPNRRGEPERQSGSEMGEYMESHQQHLILAQEVVMEEKITKKEVLEKVRQIIKKNEENEMEEIEEREE